MEIKSLDKMIRNIALMVIKYSGLPFLIRKIYQKNKVTIIYYHRIEADLFDKHLSLLKKFYTIIPLQEYLAGKTKHIKNRLIITFDDGHISNFRLLPLLKKFDVRITIFLTTGLIDSSKHFWFLTDNLNDDFKNNVKQINDDDRLNKLYEKYGFSDGKEYDIAQALNIDQVNKMMAYVDFQSHTVSHPCLPHCSYEKALREIRSSKEYLEKILNKKINCIAFPNNDYTEREIKMSLESGYKFMLTANFGFNNDSGKCLLLKRISTNDTGDLTELLLRVTGVWRILRSFMKTANKEKP